ASEEEQPGDKSEAPAVDSRTTGAYPIARSTGAHQIALTVSTSATAVEERVLCIAPAWNEGERIARVVSAVPGCVHETVVVDDGSSDDTARFAESAGATVIRQGTNRGVGAAIRSGIDYAQEKGYEVVVIVSGGGKTPPEQIPRLIEPILKGEAELVQGSRY